MAQYLKKILRTMIPARYWMARDWEARARSNAMHYVADFRQSWDDDPENFFITGLHDTDRFLGVAQWADTDDKSLLEIGCGVGRMTRHLASRFRTVTALDISPTMIDKARVLNPHLSNVTFEVSNGVDLRGLSDGSFDFIMSYIVFQHLPEPAVIERYIDEALRVLAPGGEFCFHGRNDNTPRVLDTYRGASMDLDAIRQIVRRHNREVKQLIGEGTNNCYVTVG